MPVWHVSVARLSRSLDRVLDLSDWPPNVWKQARELSQRILNGVGCDDWQREEIGKTALHTRRRLSPEGVKLLHQVNCGFPVFTHGAALGAIR